MSQSALAVLSAIGDETAGDGPDVGVLAVRSARASRCWRDIIPAGYAEPELRAVPESQLGACCRGPDPDAAADSRGGRR